MRWTLALLGVVACACASPATATRSAPIYPATGSTPPRSEPVLRGVAPDPSEAAPEAADTFAWWDRDRDGVLTADELTEIWIAHLDRDGDGAVTPSEWPG